MEDSQILDLLVRMQHALCKLLIYANKTADYAQEARSVAEVAAQVLREQGREPAELAPLPSPMFRVSTGKERPR
jgi:hypothetical protein